MSNSPPKQPLRPPSPDTHAEVIEADANFAVENDRLDLQHHSCLLTLNNKLYLCAAGRDGKPFNRVLDAGCGTGIWAVDFADEHPETQVIGVDLSPIQPSFVPPNVSFFVDDLEEPWAYNDPFDFIYFRLMVGSITDWPRLLKQAYQNVRPGGYVELMDATYPVDCDDETLTPENSVFEWNRLLCKAAASVGKPLDEAFRYKKHLIDAGFVNVTETRYKWPMNSWPKDPKYKELGSWTLENIMEGLQGISLALFTRVLGWTAEELEVFLVDVRKQFKNKSVHGYWHIVVVYGQKPE
ncbi:hypothetical protein SAPIO_CDS9496 [Scedosporium apiospermum]|uniref:Methyltransferase domain-containing protein n=1 Tax=Pseudallescheria apiosperma TaxID=563466 RepID=A0A084FWX3_PSEDA|nr:uncharacterized protein SAPIO_CDS9496 [Scedosporium apiospermum]KEZ39585.1 hypothetical protein SAPIO_CDS9496 [Scedosporium apiospermum]